MGGVADVDEDCAADEIPDRMRYFGGENIHEVAAVVVLVPVGRSDGAVGEAADRVAAAEEVAFIERRIFFPVADGADHADFSADGPDEHLVEDGVIVHALEFETVVVVGSAEEFGGDGAEEVHHVSRGRVERIVARIPFQTQMEASDIASAFFLLEDFRHVFAHTVDSDVFKGVSAADGGEVVENAFGERGCHADPLFFPVVVFHVPQIFLASCNSLSPLVFKIVNLSVSFINLHCVVKSITPANPDI